jgi:uncharacterized membrane protein YkvA (DUF1232 family)
MDGRCAGGFNGAMSKASDRGFPGAFDLAQVIPRSRALTPAVIRLNEERVRRGFWPKLRQVVGRIPFAADLVSLYYCAVDPETPAMAKAMMMAALAYFVLPWDAIPDVLVGIGYTDDAAVIAAVIALTGRHLKPRHKAAAQALLDRMSSGG